MSEAPVRLTQFSRGSGCGCKISPALLREIIGTGDALPPDVRLVVGNENCDDAAVYDLGNGSYLVSTTDFFMPVVDDAFDFGKIAAANALSDVYAMGASPLFALAILGWPVEKIPVTEARRVMDGARFICRMAGIVLAGGHSIDSVEPFFGLVVNGSVTAANLKRNDTAKAGDRLYLTKPLGSGTLSSAARRGLLTAEEIEMMTGYMTELNKAGIALGALPGVTALTDVTGFGLLGHLAEMCEGSGTSARLNFASLPLMPGTESLHASFVYPDMTMKTYQWLAAKCSPLSASQIFALCDPQTNGGLLVCVDPSAEAGYLAVVHAHGLSGIADRSIGVMEKTGHFLISVE